MSIAVASTTSEWNTLIVKSLSEGHIPVGDSDFFGKVIREFYVDQDPGHAHVAKGCVGAIHFVEEAVGVADFLEDILRSKTEREA
jgi:hypothetical protein